jgi:hypothetical protein
MRFRPSRYSEYGEATTTLATTALSTEANLAALAAGTGQAISGSIGAGAAAGGAAAASGGHLSSTGFLGLNWRAIGASILVGSCVAIGSEMVVSFLKPRLFKRAEASEKK